MEDSKKKKIIIIVITITILLLLLTVTLIVVFAEKISNSTKKDNSEKPYHPAPYEIKMNWDSVGAFSNEYTSSKMIPSGVETIVKSDVDVVAPSLSGMIVLNLSGCSHMPLNLSLKVTQTYSDNWKTSADGEVYHPIVLTAFTNIAGVRRQLQIDSEGNIVFDDFEPFTVLEGNVEIVWHWPEHVSEENDLFDTYMSSVGHDATYALKAEATLVQVEVINSV